jgi:hypothetical protein
MCRDAGWFVSKPKIPIWVNFGGPCNGKCPFMSIWSILRPLEIFYRHLLDFMAIWYILWPFGMLYQKNLATLAMCAVPCWKVSYGRRSEQSNTKAFFSTVVSLLVITNANIGQLGLDNLFTHKSSGSHNIVLHIVTYYMSFQLKRCIIIHYYMITRLCYVFFT